MKMSQTNWTLKVGTVADDDEVDAIIEGVKGESDR